MMVKAKLIFCDFNNPSTGTSKFYKLKFEGDCKICEILNEIVFEIGGGRYTTNSKRLFTFRHEVIRNGREIADIKTKINLYKNSITVLTLVDDLAKIIKLKKELKSLEVKNKIFTEHIKTIRKELEQNFYEIKKKYRELLSKFGFTCTETYMKDEDTNVEVLESSLSSEQIYEMALEELNKIYVAKNIIPIKKTEEELSKW